MWGIVQVQFSKTNAIRWSIVTIIDKVRWRAEIWHLNEPLRAARKPRWCHIHLHTEWQNNTDYFRTTQRFRPALLLFFNFFAKWRTKLNLTKNIVRRFWEISQECRRWERIESDEFQRVLNVSKLKLTYNFLINFQVIEN